MPLKSSKKAKLETIEKDEIESPEEDTPSPEIGDKEIVSDYQTESSEIETDYLRNEYYNDSKFVKLFIKMQRLPLPTLTLSNVDVEIYKYERCESPYFAVDRYVKRIAKKMGCSIKDAGDVMVANFGKIYYSDEKSPELREYSFRQHTEMRNPPIL